jgi:hypothetical protein
MLIGWIFDHYMWGICWPILLPHPSPAVLLCQLLLFLLQLCGEHSHPVLSLLPGTINCLQLAGLVTVLINPASADGAEGKTHMHDLSKAGIICFECHWLQIRERWPSLNSS